MIKVRTLNTKCFGVGCSKKHKCLAYRIRPRTLQAFIESCPNERLFVPIPDSADAKRKGKGQSARYSEQPVSFTYRGNAESEYMSPKTDLLECVQ